MQLQHLSSLIILSTFPFTVTYATNGDNLIGIGSKSRAMGGTGIAITHGAESGLSNPALITSVTNIEVSFGGTLFMPDIRTELNVATGAPLPPQGAFLSDANINMIPEVSIAHKINENWYIGVGMWGTAGMGTDYNKATFNPLIRGEFGNFHMLTNLQLLQFGVPIAYKTKGLSLAVTPILQYGNLDINYKIPTLAGTIDNIGTGLSQDFGLGYIIGVSYDFTSNDMTGLTLGAMYKSSIEMNYDGQLTTATIPFGFSLPNGDTLEQPAEYGIGIAYIMGQHTFAFDYKKIVWSKTKGYGDFGWSDSDVYALGYQYTQNNWVLRTGYNYASSAVVEVTDTRLNFFNLLGFPATAESHYTFGGSYTFTHSFSVDVAYVYQPMSTKTFSTVSLGIPFSSLTTDHRENSISFQLNYTF